MESMMNHDCSTPGTWARMRSASLAFVAGWTVFLAGFAGACWAQQSTAPRAANPQSKPAGDRTAAERAVLALDTFMLPIYEDALTKYKQHMRDHVPIILAIPSESGGRMILYRPGRPPLEADPVPVIYQLTKSVSHSSMATYELVAPFVERPADKSWREPMTGYRLRCRAALDSLEALGLGREERELLRSILRQTIAFQDACLEKFTVTLGELETFARGLRNDVARAIGIASSVEVGHFFKVLEEWKKSLGPEWGRTYGVTSSIYVMRQNNIFFTILAQFIGQEAFGDRLVLLETTQFAADPDEMLEVLARIVSDRALGKVFFKDYYLMDAELLGGGARRAIIAEANRRGMTPLLPSLAPFRSTDWPWHTDPGRGTGPASMEEIK
jgi:hypothetical protein